MHPYCLLTLVVAGSEWHHGGSTGGRNGLDTHPNLVHEPALSVRRATQKLQH